MNTKFRSTVSGSAGWYRSTVPPGVRAGTRQRAVRTVAGLSLVEVMIVMGIFSLLVAGMVAGQLYSLRVYTQVATKLGATAGAREVMNGLRDQLREANAVYIGNCSSDWTSYADVTNGAQQGNAVEIYPTTNTTKYLICYLDTTAGTNRLMLYSSALGSVQQLASFITNRVVFDAEDLYGNILTNNQNSRVISMTLQFSQWEYPIGGTNFNSFNYYQLRTSATRRSID
ncbi:MAG TPA: prepilin-type N-terminal cleavage/methylation domain-containing protein [Verrucomicrobiae bacterium]|nr:prepilin-type N-terminal cleavage/methylation domain-containing protein [Verrucomicrobiae bacterium]